MGLLQEAKYLAINILSKPFGVYVLPKNKIEDISAEHDVPYEPEMWLFYNIPETIFGQRMHTRQVTLIEEGRERNFKEVVSQDKAGTSVIIYKRT